MSLISSTGVPSTIWMRLLTTPMLQLLWTFSVIVSALWVLMKMRISGLHSCSAACLLTSSAVSGTCECLAACLGACWLCSSLCNSGVLTVRVPHWVSTASCVTHTVPLHNLRQLWHSCTDDIHRIHRPRHDTHVRSTCVRKEKEKKKKVYAFQRS